MGQTNSASFYFGSDLELANLSCHCRHLAVMVLGIVTIYHLQGSNNFKMSHRAFSYILAVNNM